VRSCSFDLIEHNGDDLRGLPLIARKRQLSQLLGRAKRRAIQFVEHLTEDGPTVFKHVCLPQRAVADVAQVEEPGE
jgi:bifunctional non-homologous end joining protein LigD